MAEPQIFDLSDYVITSIESPIDEIQPIFYEPFLVELRT